MQNVFASEHCGFRYCTACVHFFRNQSIPFIIGKLVSKWQKTALCVKCNYQWIKHLRVWYGCFNAVITQNDYIL